MTIVALILVPFSVFALGVGLVLHHLSQWREAKAKPPGEEREFRWRQFRRRVQSSGMIALVGLLMFLGQLISPERQPSAFVYFWCAVVLIVLWIILLAVADIIATRSHFNRQRNRRLIESAKRVRNNK